MVASHEFPAQPGAATSTGRFRLEIWKAPLSAVSRPVGGDLTVTSVYGQGSTFTVRLPAVISDLAR